MTPLIVSACLNVFTGSPAKGNFNEDLFHNLDPTNRDGEHAPSQAGFPTTKGPGTTFLDNSHPTN